MKPSRDNFHSPKGKKIATKMKDFGYTSSMICKRPHQWWWFSSLKEIPKSIHSSFPLIFLKFREQNYFLFLYSNTLHNNFLYLFPISIKYSFFTNISFYLLSHFSQNFNTISNKRQRDER